MPPLAARVLPYLQAAPSSDGAPARGAHTASDSLVLDPFLDGVAIGYLDDDNPDRMLTASDVRKARLARTKLAALARENLAAYLDGFRVSLQPNGAIISIACGASFEATLMLSDDFWPLVHEKLGPEILVVAPARDVLAAGPLDALDELQALVDRVWTGNDRLLTRNVFRRVDGEWSVYRKADGDPPARQTWAAPLHSRVLPYLKAILPDDGSPAIKLSESDSPILDPFLADLVVAYAVDEGDCFELVNAAHTLAANLSLADLRAAARENLAAYADQGRVKMHVNGSLRVFLFDGNLEATLILWEDLWTVAHEALGPELLVVVPARDILAAGPPSALGELQGVIDRVWPVGDHLLSRGVFRRLEGEWSVYRRG